MHHSTLRWSWRWAVGSALLPPADYCTYRATSSSATQIFKWCSKTLWIFFYSTIILEQIKFKISSNYQVFCLIWLKSKQYITYKTHKTVLGKQANFLQVFKKCLFCLGNFAHKVAKMQTTTLKQQCAQSRKKSCTATQLLHNYDYYVLKILQISETWQKITESEMVFELFAPLLLANDNTVSKNGNFRLKQWMELLFCMLTFGNGWWSVSSKRYLKRGSIKV